MKAKKYGSAVEALAQMPLGSLFVSVPHIRSNVSLTSDEVGTLIEGGLFYSRDPLRGGRGRWLVSAEALLQFFAERTPPLRGLAAEAGELASGPAADGRDEGIEGRLPGLVEGASPRSG
jgi:hypothetical protein